jgi:hypothetical protein
MGKTRPRPVDEKHDTLDSERKITGGRSVFLLVVVVLSLVTVPLLGGRLANLARAHLRAIPAVFAALAMQVVAISLLPAGSSSLVRALHLASYAFAAAFLLANLRIPGLRMIAVGALANAIAIAANGGVLPASRGALRAAGLLRDRGGFVNSGYLAHPRLLFLGDVFEIPRSIPLHNVFSVGDICIAIGAAVAIHALSGSRASTRRLSFVPTV